MKFLMDFVMPPLKISKFVGDVSHSRNNNYFLPMPTNTNENSLYTCENYPLKVINNFNALRHDSRFCDVEIVTENRIFKAHRAVLAASSPYFQAMFTGGLCEKNQRSVHLHAISSHIFEFLLDFIYSGKILINRNNVQELTVAADMLELNEVVVGCTQFLIKELHSVNAVGIYRFAEAHNFTELTHSAVGYIQTHFPQVCKEDEIYELPKDHMIKFLHSEQLVVDSEYQVFQAAVRWITHDIMQRRRYVFEVLKNVRLPLLSLGLLEKSIVECSDSSLRVALKSIYSDLVNKKGCLVPLSVKPRLCAKKDIFVIGGSKRELNTVWDRGPDFNYVSTKRFDTFKREWCSAPNMSTNRIVPGVAALNGQIYVIGGEQESTILSCCECYDPEQNDWRYIADMLRPRCEFGLCALDGYLYALGGWMGRNIGGNIERYDPQVDCWEEMGSLPEPRFSMGIVCYEGLIYMVGGCSESVRFLQDLMCYNPKTQVWQPLAPMSIARSQMGVAVIDDYLYVVGGNCKDQVLNSVERYSFKKNQWSEMPPMSHARSGPAVATVDGILYVIGGLQPHETPFYRAQFTLASVESFDPLSGAWSECPPLPESRTEAGAVVM